MGRTGGINVKAEDIIDIIDGYKGGGYGVSTQHELGGYTLVGLGELFFKQMIFFVDEKEFEEVCRNCSQDWLGNNEQTKSTMKPSPKSKELQHVGVCSINVKEVGI